MTNTCWPLILIYRVSRALKLCIIDEWRYTHYTIMLPKKMSNCKFNFVNSDKCWLTACARSAIGHFFAFDEFQSWQLYSSMGMIIGFKSVNMRELSLDWNTIYITITLTITIYSSYITITWTLYYNISNMKPRGLCYSSLSLDHLYLLFAVNISIVM